MFHTNERTGTHGQTLLNKAKESREGSPNQIAPETADTVAWAMAQSTAMSKLKIFNAMAKSINDQQ